MKKAIYVLEILLEVAKVILPFVKSRPITIERNNDNQDSAEDIKS